MMIKILYFNCFGMFFELVKNLKIKIKMQKITYFLVVLFFSSSMFSCRKNTDSYIIFKNSNYNEINDDDVTVDLNSNFDLIINSGFPQKNNRPNYFMKINQNMEVLLDDSSQYYYRESQEEWPRRGL